VLSRSEILAILEHDVGEGREIVLSEQVEQLLDEAEGRVPVALHGHAQMYFLHRADEGFESRLALLREALAGQRPVQCTFLEYSGRIVEIGWARPGDSPRGDDERPQR
jgi:hypothetical protein